MKKLGIVILCFIMVLSLAACAPAHKEEDVIAAAKDLIEKSYEVNEIYYGKGLPSTGESSIGLTSQYSMVDPSCGYSTIDQLKELAAKVYSSDYCEHLYTIAFEGISNPEDEESVSFARYIVDFSDTLTVSNDAAKNGIDLNRTYDFSTIIVEKIARNKAIISIQSLVDGEEDKVLKINLVFENDQWRLNTPTY